MERAPRTASVMGLRELALEVVDHLAHDPPRRLARLLGNHVVERQQCPHQVNVGLHRLERLGLEQHLLKVQPLERVFLHHLHDRLGKVSANIAQPAIDVGTRASQPGRAVRVVECLEHLVHLRIVAHQTDRQALFDRACRGAACDSLPSTSRHRRKSFVFSLSGHGADL